MDNYIQLHFHNVKPVEQEIIIAILTDHGFDGFEQGADYLNACIPENLFIEAAVMDTLSKKGNSFAIQTITPRNWNEEWERSFEPVIIDGFCSIRATFHPPVGNVKHEIIITPKMSFGTGHHATTFQVIQLMQHIDFKGKRVLDFGTGTGVLAILAAKLGAQEVLAIDNDDWSIANARENIQHNHCPGISILKWDGMYMDRAFDVILANLNKHIILQNLQALAKQLVLNGVLVLSGLLKTDEQDIVSEADREGLTMIKRSDKSDWIALCFVNVKRG